MPHYSSCQTECHHYCPVTHWTITGQLKNREFTAVRLTLRTLLAYLDDILEPQDSEDLRKKIDESKFATELVQRTRDCIRRLRLPAPPLNGRGLAGDANSVAEYLDNTLPAERVADFEKICLESDSHLAEVAACHQILTLVLGEPADVDPAARERIYGVIDQADTVTSPRTPAPAPPVDSETAPPPVIAAAPALRRSRPEVPDYLRESRSRFWPVAAVLLIAALLTSGILAVVAPPEWRETAANWFQREPGEPTSDVPVGGSAPPARPEAASDQPEAPKLEEPKVTNSDTPPESPSAVLEAPVPQSNQKNQPAPPITFSKPADTGNDDSPLAPLPPEPASGAPMKPKPADDGNVGRPVAAAEMPLEPTASKPDPAKPTLPVETPPAAGNPATPPRIGDSPPAFETSGEGIGRYLSGDILLRFDQPSSTWRRVQAKAILLGSDRLLSLPTFRPSITLLTGLSVQPIGAADFELTGLDAQGVPGIALDYGRLVLVTIGRAGNLVRLRLGDHSGLVTFLDAESGLAIEVRHLLVPGQNPETQPAVQAIDLYSTSGEIRWEENGQVTAMRAPAGRRLSPPPVVELDGTEQPKWIASDNLTALDQRAASSLEHEITLDRMVSMSLKELAESRRAEVRTLAVRCSGYVGEFEPFVAALNDADQRTEWPRHIEALKAALARSPKTAALVRQAFEKHRGAEADELYRMLWGYSPEDLKDGAATKLVEYLNHDSLDYRVLSFWNLQNITGLTLFYRPESPVAKRRPQYLKWKERVKDGKILPASASPAKAAGGPRSARPPATEPE